MSRLSIAGVLLNSQNSSYVCQTRQHDFGSRFQNGGCGRHSEIRDYDTDGVEGCRLKHDTNGDAYQSLMFGGPRKRA
ncbi:MAG: hypothetical protein WCH61_00960 [bacterium]